VAAQAETKLRKASLLRVAIDTGISLWRFLGFEVARLKVTQSGCAIGGASHVAEQLQYMTVVEGLH